MKNEYLITYTAKIPFEVHLSANSLEDAILFVKKHDENGKIYKNYRNGIDEVGKTQIGSSENGIISIKKINKREIELDGIT